MSFYKDDKSLRSAALAPGKPIGKPAAAATALRSVAHTYNRIGGLVDTLGAVTGIETLAALAVWLVESGGRLFVKGRPVLRFENHIYWDRWGKDHASTYDQHFVFGGHGATGRRWEGHKWRKNADGAWQAFHGSQDSEYEVYRFAKTLSGREPAAQSASWGGTQVMGFNHDLLGYESASDLVDAFLADERWQVLGFFDFCKSSGLIASIKAHNWVAFGNGYNGPGGGAVYGPKLQAIYALKDQFAALRH